MTAVDPGPSRARDLELLGQPLGGKARDRTTTRKDSFVDHTDLGDAGAASRRRFLRAGLTGAAMSAALPLLARSATAQEAGAPAPTTAPPRRPEGDDVALLNFAASLELAARDLYGVAVAAGIGDGATAEALAGFERHHQAYAEALGALLGPRALRQRNDDVFDQLATSFASASEVVLAAHDLEEAAAATHTELLASLQSTEGAALVASILVAESQHAVVLASLAGITDLDTLLTNQADALAPAGGADETE